MSSTGVIPSTGNIKVLIIFVKFSDDNTVTYPSDWDPILFEHSRPPWTEQMIMSSPTSDPYHPSISGYCDQLSSGRCKIYGNAFPPYPQVFEPLLLKADYKSKFDGCSGTRQISWAVYEALTELDAQIDYRQYDNDGPDGEPCSGDDDGYVDLIIIWFRLGYFGETDCSNYDGVARLTGLNRTVFLDNLAEIETDDLYNGNKIKIKPDNGLIANGYSPIKIDIMVHELSHLMGQNYHFPNWHLGKWSLSEARTGVGIPCTFERGGLGWLLPNTVTEISTPGTYYFTIGNDNPLHDYEASGECIRIITQYSGRYQIENRSGLQFYSKLGNWVMPGNGLLIYEGSAETVECADHVWNWETDGVVNCDPCDNRHNLKFVFNNGLKKLSPNISGIKDLDLFGICTNIGCLTLPEASGDAGDLYNPSYNTVFSRWSNPICALGPNGNPIVIEHLGKNADSSVNILIKYDLADAYSGTSPSKPLLFECKEDYFDPNNEYIFHPKLTWKRNTEPDMQTNAYYKIYRADLTGSGEYSEIATIAAPSSGDNVIYKDETITLYNPGSPNHGVCWIMKNYAYKVKAVDNEALSSVLSDKRDISGYEDPCSEEGDKINNLGGNIPKEYKIFNYPNPFNPSTEIKFSLPKESVVTIKVYNLLGKEVISLINHDYKEAGNYSVVFDGSDFASGVYFYRIEAGSFTATKKMVLIK